MSREVLPTRIVTEHQVDLSEPPGSPQGRNVFICLDGTWNDERSPDGGAGAPSNVRRLYDCLTPDSEGQIARYFRGVGNRQDNSWWRTKLYGFTGGDERRIRRAALATINKEYRPGDNLFIIGFSRGAACARLLATDLHTRGLYERLTITSRRFMNRVTRQVETRVVDYRGGGMQLRHVPVRFLGCWDTVGAFVIPVRFPHFRPLDWLFRGVVHVWGRLRGYVPFRNQTLSPAVQRAVHCVAIDETRNAFLPTLMDQAEHIEEVWFPGVHADVGGGYASDGLRRVTLKFMLDRIDRCVREQDLRPIEWDKASVETHSEESEEPEFHLHFHGLRRGLYGKRIRHIRVRNPGGATDAVKPRIHWSVALLWQSDQVYACNAKKGCSWRVDYRPFNVSELNAGLAGLRASAADWPFEWVGRPEDGYV